MEDFAFRSLPRSAEDKRRGRRRDAPEFAGAKLKPAVSTCVYPGYFWRVDKMSEKSREASDMLAAAIQQMDGILAGESFSHNFLSLFYIGHAAESRAALRVTLHTAVIVVFAAVADAAPTLAKLLIPQTDTGAWFPPGFNANKRPCSELWWETTHTSPPILPLKRVQTSLSTIFCWKLHYAVCTS